MFTECRWAQVADLFHAHIGGMDALARGLRNAAKVLEEHVLADLVADRYRSWAAPDSIGAKIQVRAGRY
jgi:xylose isomerase